MSPEPSSTTCTGIRQILQAALELFAENGYEGVSVHSIAERAGVSKANVFHHFASKEALYLAVLRSASSEWGDEMEAQIGAPGDFATRLRAMIGNMLRRLCETQTHSRLMLREILENGALRAQQLNDDVFARNFELEVAIFRRAKADGDLRVDLDPVIAWMMTLSACVFFFQSRDLLRHNPAFRHYADTPDDYADQVCTVLLRGIASKAHQAKPTFGSNSDSPQA